MEWVKNLVGYYRLLEIATGTDEMEVMFKRADALAGELVAADGFIPDAMLPSLTRRPARAKKIAEQLVDAGLWVRVKGGYLIVDWVSINAELVKIQERKRRERDRKRASRQASRDVSADAGADSPADGPQDSLSAAESKSQSKNAAAASGAPPSAGADLPEAVEILRATLDARRLIVRWDRLTTDELAEIVDLINQHGDAALVKSALSSFQPDRPPVYARAWLGQWRQLRAPGALALVDANPCPEPGHSGTTRHCTQCASEALATPKENR